MVLAPESVLVRELPGQAIRVPGLIERSATALLVGFKPIIEGPVQTCALRVGFWQMILLTAVGNRPYRAIDSRRFKLGPDKSVFGK